MFKSGQYVTLIGAESAKVAVVQQNDLAAVASRLAWRSATRAKRAINRSGGCGFQS